VLESNRRLFFCVHTVQEENAQVVKDREQELSYRKQIARQLRTQYVEGIYGPKYYTVTLKSSLKVTQGQWKRNHWTDHRGLTVLVDLCYVEYYRDLEMRVRGHSRSL